MACALPFARTNIPVGKRNAVILFWFEHRRAMHLMRKLLIALISLCALIASPAHADLRTPNWYDPDGVGSGYDWHYRVPVTVPAGATIDGTIKVDIDFVAVGTAFGAAATLDLSSIRVVRPGGQLATRQEYTDAIYAGATDAINNNRGEVRFLLEDGGGSIYWIYFDAVENGAKPANPQQPIGGNFESSTSGATQAAGWDAPTGAAALDAQVRPSETVSVTTDGANVTRSTNGTPRSGAYSYLIGSRSANEPVGGGSKVLTRTIKVPASSPGDLNFRWRPEGWDSSNWDTLTVEIVGSTTQQIIGPGYGNYATAPYSPNLGPDPASGTLAGYGHYNGFDMTTGGAHTQGMTVAYGAEVWFTRTVSLAAFAGQTVTLRITSGHSETYRSWFHIDDIEWSVSAGTVGSAQAFGVNITQPTSGGNVAPGGTISITAVVDANPTATTNPVTVDIYNPAATAVATGIRLFNDGTRGDAIANDAIWTNNGSDAGAPTYTVPGGTTGSGWLIRVFAKDRSSSMIGAPNGLLRGPGTGAAAATQANFWNVDEHNFSVLGATISATVTSAPITDPINLTTGPKHIPGGQVRYCVTISNAGPADAQTLNGVHIIPISQTYIAGTIKSGATCAAAATVEDDDASDTGEADTITASASGNTISVLAAALAANASFAVTFDATIN